MLTKNYLEYLGIIDVSKEGKIFTKNGELKPRLFNSKRYYIDLHDPAKYASVQKEKKNTGSGRVTLQVSKVVYAWFNKIIPDNHEIHHRDLNPHNNSIDNLECLTKEEHKAKHASTTEEKCRLDRPREYYVDKIEEYKAAGKPQGAYHYECRLRYYDNHTDEAYQAQKDKRDLAMIKELAKEAKQAQNLVRWKQLNSIAKNWKSYDSELKEKLIQVILKGHTFNID